MKKLLITMLVCIAYLSVSWGRPSPNRKRADNASAEVHLTEAQYRATLTKMIAADSLDKVSEIAEKENFWTINGRKDLRSLLHEADEALGAKGFAKYWKYCNIWKKVSANERKANGADAAYPKMISLALRLNTAISMHSFMCLGASIDELVECLNEAIAFPEKCPLSALDIDAGKKAIQKAAVKGIKRALREQGKSFVTKDGVNPCEVYMERLNKALNAPRFEGLNDWLAELGFSARIDASKLPSKEKIESIKDAIFYGERKASNLDKTILSVCLGVDGYNEFVKKYNGD